MEAIIIICLAFRGWPLLIGFILALFLLAIFSWAIQRVLARGIQTACHCFSNSSNSVTAYDIWRNVGFIGWALAGLGGAALGIEGELTTLGFLLFAIVSFLFFVTWIHISEIIGLFQSEN